MDIPSGTSTVRKWSCCRLRLGFLAFVFVKRSRSTFAMLLAVAPKVMYWMDLSRRLLHVCNCRMESALCRLNFGILTKVIKLHEK